MNKIFLLMAISVLSACQPEPPQLLGSTEWDRISVPAEWSEQIIAIETREGALVEQGALLLQLDARRAKLRHARLRAELDANQAQLDELLHGTRVEDIAAARAELQRTQALLQEAELVLGRQMDLRKRGLNAAANLDAARAGRDSALAARNGAKANVEKLGLGAREEQIAARLALRDVARASLEEFELTLAKLQVLAPRAGRIDALPFKLGDQPPLGASIVSLLVGEKPFVRVFIPASERLNYAPGTRCRIAVLGRAEPLEGRVRFIQSEASFTPYYALTGKDASRVVYRAEIDFVDALSASLPAGVSVRVSAF